MLNQNIRMGVYDIISELNLSQNAGAYMNEVRRTKKDQKYFFPYPKNEDLTRKDITATYLLNQGSEKVPIRNRVLNEHRSCP